MIGGIYLLSISVRRSSAIKVGSLDKVFFEKGTYIYVGSGQKNLLKRIRRHLRGKKKTFWHIDYLLARNFTQIQDVFIKQTDKSAECTLARKLLERGDPVLGFGCSDCFCPSHLIRLKNDNIEDFLSANDLREFSASVGQESPNAPNDLSQMKLAFKTPYRRC